LQRGELEAAEAAFRKVLATEPRAGAAYANLGVIAMRREQWDQALTLLEKAAKLEPKMAGIRLNIGLVKYRSGDYAGAIAPLASVVHDQPESQQARYLVGLCNVFTEHYADAVTALEPLWPQQSSDFMYLYVLGIAAHNSNRKELDEKALNRQLEQAQQRFEVGLAAITDVNDAKAQHDAAVANVISAQNNVDTARETVRQLTNKEPGEFKKLREDLPLDHPTPDDPKQWVDLALKQNPVLTSASLNVDAAAANVNTARAGHLPVLNANLGYSRAPTWGDTSVSTAPANRTDGARPLPAAASAAVSSNRRRNPPSVPSPAVCRSNCCATLPSV